MKSSLVLLVCIAALLAACAPRSLVLPAAPPAEPLTVSAPPDASGPGLVISGHVRLSDGSPLSDVVICRSFASYPGIIVGVTDASGYYQARFAAIPGDEMVGVWPQAAGYAFTPGLVRWRHYHGHEERTLDFVATASSATGGPPASC